MYEIKEVLTRDSWKRGDEAAVVLDIKRPYIEDVPKRVNRYYSYLEKRLKSFCGRRARAGEKGVYRLDYTVGLCDEKHISIYCDVYLDGFIRARTACTWDAFSGYPLPLGHFTELSRRAIIARIASEIENDRFRIYFKSYAKRLKRFYDPDNFWLSGSGINFYYQPLALAPVEYGVSHFLL